MTKSFKVGDTVVCVDSSFVPLTNGSTYVVARLDGSLLKVKDDCGRFQYLGSWRFKLKEKEKERNEEFKAGDVVVCVDKGTNNHITIGKEYTVVHVSGEEVFIKNDEGRTLFYYSSRFKKKEKEEKMSRMIETTITKRVKDTHLVGNLCVRPVTDATKNISLYHSQNVGSFVWLNKKELKQLIEDLQEVYNFLDEQK